MNKTKWIQWGVAAGMLVGAAAITRIAAAACPPCPPERSAYDLTGFVPFDGSWHHITVPVLDVGVLDVGQVGGFSAQGGGTQLSVNNSSLSCLYAEATEDPRCAAEDTNAADGQSATIADPSCNGQRYIYYQARTCPQQ